MLLSHRHPLLYKLAVFYHRQKRALAWLMDQKPYASEFRKGERLPFKVKIWNSSAGIAVVVPYYKENHVWAKFNRIER